MPQPIMAILAHQNELSALARSRLGDVNEASLVVARVLGRAMRQTRTRSSDEISDEIWRDFEITLDRSRLS